MGTDHTPTPWKVSPPLKDFDSLGRAIVRAEAVFNEHGQTTTEFIVDTISEANAAHIVRCVNSHEALVEALTYLLNETEDYIKINNLSALHNHSLEMAREALAQADEKGAARP